MSAVKIRAESEFTFETPLTVEQVREIVADAVGRFADEHPSVLDFEVFLGAPGNIGIKILLTSIHRWALGGLCRPDRRGVTCRGQG